MVSCAGRSDVEAAHGAANAHRGIGENADEIELSFANTDDNYLKNLALLNRSHVIR